MKVTFDIECTPEEARTFFGLPDVQPMQEAMMDEMQKKAMENIKAMDPETMMKTWLPAAFEGWTDIQKAFWTQMGMTIPEATKK